MAITGGGVTGYATAKALGRDYSDVFLFEKNPGITD
jgi:L-2-hydroxyglutarate oxidase LhgO